MTLNISVPQKEFNLAPKITVIGVGGAGGNAVNNMIQSNVEGVDFLISNTDSQALGLSLCERRIQMGRSITQGLGAGSRPDIGRAAAEEQLDEILAELDGANMVFITAGMGGGTGTGAAPVIARAAREAGILTVGVVTKPFQFEGVHRMRMAEAGIAEMTQYVDTLIVIPNQNLFRVANEKTTFADAFKMADDVLRSGVRGVTDLMVMPGLINLDFADIRSVMTEMGKAMMGTGEAEGENRAINAAEAAISNPLLDDVSMKGARGVLINISGGMDLTLFEVDETANRIRDEVDPDANIIFGAIFDQSLEGRMRVSVVATGIEAEAAEAPIPSSIPLSLVSNQGAPRVGGFGGSGSGGGMSATSTAQAYEPAYEVQGEPVAQSEPAMIEAEPTPMMEVAPQAEFQGNRLFAYSQEVEQEHEETEDRLFDAMAETASQAPVVQAEGPRSITAGRRQDVFIAPKAIEASQDAELDLAQEAADPFAAADVAAESPAPEIERPSLGFDRKKAQRLFATLTENAARALSGSVHAGEPLESRRSEPSLDGSGREPRHTADSTPQTAEPVSVQPGLTGLDTTATTETTREEEDFLDIPAFLRRQAN